ncbi:MAG: hypothetical protein EBZ69_01855 [Alphaproteobacteria bacterium]|nr:hypothetical protein [Alphaproteobacteria bacterium]NDC55550.1 hypothetical protein [Alphaproteobacteria bacterium]NDG05315.1 hypothetical protein [Alphaproteobacteria bacterium]
MRCASSVYVKPINERKKNMKSKMRFNLRVSPEVLAFFKAKGPGWQTRIDDALKAFVALVKD